MARLQRIVPAERLQDVVETFSTPAAVGFRLNTLRVQPSETIEELTASGLRVSHVDSVPGAFTVPADQRAQLLASEPVVRGAVYLQNVSSQLPPLILNPQPGERVLDLCAAPGSKTRQMACLMRDEGEIVAVEKIRKRFFKLKANIAAQGSTTVRPILGSGSAFWHREPEAFDRVLVDAPCSSEGRFRAEEPETTRYWSLRKIKEMQSKQRKLLYAGIQALKPGGKLVYSTCALAPEENEVVIAKALKTFDKAVAIRPVEAGWVGEVSIPGLNEWDDRVLGDQLNLAQRVLPNGVFSGFFIALIEKVSSTIRP